jgi:HlyD family secretion protein
MIQGTQNSDRVIERTGRFSGRWSWVLALAIVLAGAAWAAPTAVRWFQTDRSVARAELRFATVTRGDLERDLGVEGRVVAARHPSVFSPARGIVHLTVQAGQVVAADEVVARVESPERTSELAREVSALDAQQSDLESRRLRGEQTGLGQQLEIEQLEVRAQAAERGMARAQLIFDQGLVNRIELERAQDELTLARQSLAHAKRRAELDHETRLVEVRQAEQQVERQRLLVGEQQRRVDELAVRAPVAGLVGSLEVADRDAVTDGQALVTVVDLSAFAIEIEVPEAWSDEAVLGLPVAVRVEGSEHEAQILGMAPSVAAGVVRGRVGFAGPPPPGLKQGQRVSCRLLLDRRIDVVKVERGPFVESGGGQVAYVLDGDVARKRRIELGALSVREVEVRSGLLPGDVLILSDTRRFADADSVLLR